MPAIAGIGAAIASGASAAMTAVGAIGLAGLAQGAAIVGTGLGIVGKMTGSKTLTKIGMGIGLAGGAGMLASSMRAGTSAKGLLAATSDDALAAPTKGLGSSKFGSELWQSSTAATAKDSTAISGATFDPEFEKNYFQRANDTLTKYNTLLNVAGGIGQAYMQGAHMDLQKELLDKRLDFDQQLIDRVNKNNGTVLTGINPAFGPNNVARDTQAYSGILRGG